MKQKPRPHHTRGTEDGAFSTRRPGIAEIRSHLAARQLTLRGQKKEDHHYYSEYSC